MLNSIESSYRGKINLLKNTIRKGRTGYKKSKNAQKKLLTALEKTLKNEKIYRATEMMDVWRCEKEKFDMLKEHDGFLEI